MFCVNCAWLSSTLDGSAIQSLLPWQHSQNTPVSVGVSWLQPKMAIGQLTVVSESDSQMIKGTKSDYFYYNILILISRIHNCSLTSVEQLKSVAIMCYTGVIQVLYRCYTGVIRVSYMAQLFSSALWPY